MLPIRIASVTTAREPQLLAEDARHDRRRDGSRDGARVRRDDVPDRVDGPWRVRKERHGRRSRRDRDGAIITDSAPALIPARTARARRFEARLVAGHGRERAVGVLGVSPCPGKCLSVARTFPTAADGRDDVPRDVRGILAEARTLMTGLSGSRSRRRRARRPGRCRSPAPLRPSPCRGAPARRIAVAAIAIATGRTSCPRSACRSRPRGPPRRGAASSPSWSLMRTAAPYTLERRA